jgi:hypothetical protein
MICLLCRDRHVEVVAHPVGMCNVCLSEFWKSAEGEHALVVAASFVARKLDQKEPGVDPPYVWGRG